MTNFSPRDNFETTCVRANHAHTWWYKRAPYRVTATYLQPDHNPGIFGICVVCFKKYISQC